MTLGVPMENVYHKRLGENAARKGGQLGYLRKKSGVKGGACEILLAGEIITLSEVLGRVRQGETT